MSVCLDPQRARSWHLIDSDELLVDAGRQRFHLQLSYACPELTYNHTVEFTAGNGVGRLCGSSGDSVATVSSRWRRARCEISVVTPLEKVAYASYLKGVPEGVVETRDPEQDLPQAPSD